MKAIKKWEIPAWLRLMVVAAVLVALALIVSFVSKFGVQPADAQEKWGQFGDFVGGILNPLFSITALFALLHTIVLQSRELKRSTKELKASAKALAKQNKYYSRQQFDSNFFQLLAFQLELQKKFSTKNDNYKDVHGVSAFNYLRYGYSREYREIEGGQYPDHASKALCAFDSWERNYSHGIYEYMHPLSNIIGYIYYAKVSVGGKKFAFETLLSHLSSAEIDLLFYISLHHSAYNWLAEVDKDYQLFGSASSQPFGEDIFDGIRADFVAKVSRLKEAAFDSSECMPDS
ncbi:hypothetical protein ACIQUS_25760 [Pseudomonas sp. NPDC090755]|uniref:hypothetical protein n=1 Tax=Pseudomonas sp. NPDC090755 TaxID=3364481 RepID=UPI00383B9FD3